MIFKFNLRCFLCLTARLDKSNKRSCQNYFIFSFILAPVELLSLSSISDFLCSQNWNVWCLTSAISAKRDLTRKIFVILMRQLTQFRTESGAKRLKSSSKKKTWKQSKLICFVWCASLSVYRWFARDKKSLFNSRLTKKKWSQAQKKS